jgi:hypothetical protein
MTRLVQRADRGSSGRFPSIRSVGGVKPLIWRELTAKVDTGFVLAPALRLECDPRIAGGGEERSILARHVTAVSKRLSTCRAARIHALLLRAHAYTVGVGNRRDHVSGLGPRPPKDAILISGTGTVHWYGCDHLPDYEFLVPPKYGWIEDRDVWPRIGNHEVRATGGNLARLAQRRCLDCDY